MERISKSSLTYVVEGEREIASFVSESGRTKESKKVTILETDTK